MLKRRHGDVCQSGLSCPLSCDHEQSLVLWMRAKVAPRAALKRLVRSRDALEQIGAMGGAGAGFITGAGGEGVHSIPPCGTGGPSGMVRRQLPRRYMTSDVARKPGVRSSPPQCQARPRKTIRPGPESKGACAQHSAASSSRGTGHGFFDPLGWPRLIGTTIFNEEVSFSVQWLS